MQTKRIVSREGGGPFLYGVCELTITVKPAEIEWEEKDIRRHLKKNEVLNVSARNIENI